MAPSRYLLEDESIALEVRRHPWVLAGPAGAALLATALAVVAGYVSGPRSSSDLVDIVGGLGALAVWVRFGWRALRWYTTRIVVTDQRILLISGIVSQAISGVGLARIEEFTYRRPFLGRLLGFGELILEGANLTHGVGRIDHIPEPDRFYRVVVGLLGSPRGPRLVTPSDDEDTGPIPRVVL